MLKKMKRGMEKWGHYLLALLCAGVILVSAAWTRDQKTAEEENRMALSDQSQRLSEVEPTAEPMTWMKPTDGKMIQGYSTIPVFFAATGVWKTHAGKDFSAEAGEGVVAMAAGTVMECGPILRIDHGNGYVSLYQEMDKVNVREGQRVKAGETLGTAGKGAPYEGKGHICVTLLKDGTPIDFDTQ